MKAFIGHIDMECWHGNEDSGVDLLLESAVLPSQKIIHFLFPFGFEEDAEEDGHHGQEAGAGHHGHQQPREAGVWGERQGHAVPLRVRQCLKLRWSFISQI